MSRNREIGPPTARGRQALSHPRQALSHPRQALSHPRQALSQPRQALSHPRQALSHPRQALSHPRQALSHPRRRVPNFGFTLIELLVAVLIFAIMSGFAYRGLTGMLDSREALERESRKWRDVALFVGRLERDLGAAMPRVATGASSALLAPISSAIEGGSGSEGLALTRAGSPLMENALAAPQRVAWRLREGRVERLAWASVDAAPRDEPAGLAVLDSVSALAFRFLDPASKEWRTSWGLPGAGHAPLPAAVEMTVTLGSGERIVRLIDLVRPPS